jgi:hypothetical protein
LPPSEWSKNTLARNQHHAESKQTLKMEATCFCETWVNFQGTTRRYIPEDRRTLHHHRCENLNSHMDQPNRLGNSEAQNIEGWHEKAFSYPDGLITCKSVKSSRSIFCSIIILSRQVQAAHHTKTMNQSSHFNMDKGQDRISSDLMQCGTVCSHLLCGQLGNHFVV